MLLLLVAGQVAVAQGGGRSVTRQLPHRDSTVAWTGYGYRGTVGRGQLTGRIRRTYPVVTSVVSGSPADSAGMKVGDEVLSINGFDFVSQFDSAHFMGPGIPIRVRVQRADSVLQLVLTPIPFPSKP